jgi:hypothetical protein
VCGALNLGVSRDFGAIRDVSGRLYKPFNDFIFRGGGGAE